VTALLEERIKELTFAAVDLGVPDRRILITSKVEEDGEGERVEVRLPVEPAERAEIEADELVEGSIVADCAVDVAVGRVGLKDESRVRLAKSSHFLVRVVLGTVNDGRLPAAVPDLVSARNGDGGVDVALVKHGDASRVDGHAPLLFSGIVLQVLRDEVEGDIVKSRCIAGQGGAFQAWIPEL